MTKQIVDVEAVLAKWGKPTNWDQLSDYGKKQWLTLRAPVDVVPAGWHYWDGLQQRKFLEAQQKKRMLDRRKATLIEQRARRETFRFKTIPDFSGEPHPETPVGYIPTPGKPRYVIRAVYGPAMGLPMSRLLGLLYDKRYLSVRVPGGIKQYENDPRYGKKFEELGQPGPTGIRKEISDVVDTAADGFDPSGGGRSWGPREFLWHLFEMVARCDGDCEIFFVHNQVRMEVDKESFKEWVRRSEEDPTTALLEPLKLLTNQA